MLVEFLSSHSSVVGTLFSQYNLDNAPFKSGIFIIEPGFTSILDAHSVKECWFVFQGSGELSLEGTVKVVREGEMIFFNSFEKHQITNTGPRDIKILSIWWNA
ncbi:Cupin domain-containing protein [Chitinophaga sp. CF118]|uniref:cupin domain-containing protein n=1 Tax=Chitinophaga sp. CF118 TaxID=1884367 RepID=UPI0008E287AC|nr:cupin domain-containing protein [Chitinophaga sp. CF118]SFD00918.1 Cupin domain-containing protein [Chitinophaga sp. CF118]